MFRCVLCLAKVWPLSKELLGVVVQAHMAKLAIRDRLKICFPQGSPDSNSGVGIQERVDLI